MNFIYKNKLFLKLNNYIEPFTDINSLINEINQYTVEFFSESMSLINYNSIYNIEDKLSEEKMIELRQILIPFIDVQKKCDNGEEFRIYKLKKDSIVDLSEKIYKYSNALISIYVAENKISDFPLI